MSIVVLPGRKETILRFAVLIFFMLYLAPQLIFSASIDPLLQKYNLKIEEVAPIVLKVGTLAPPGTPWINYIHDRVVPMFNAEMRGRIKFEIYPGGVMGNDTDVLRKMSLRQLQGCGCTALGILGTAPEAGIFVLPMLFNNYEEVDYILSKFRPDIEAMFEKRGYYITGLIDSGFFYMFSKKRIEKIDDMKKQKMLTWFGTIEAETLNLLGINPVNISLQESVMAFQTGIINANIAPPTWQLGTQAYTETNFYIAQPLFYSVAAVLYDKAQIESISSRYPGGFGRDIVRLAIDLTKKLEPEWKRELREFEKKSLMVFEKRGMQSVQLSPEDVEKMREVAREVWMNLGDRLYSKELLERILNELNKFRK
ncbi:MAG TPA: TRAP transporter substrate-binding protein DctP [bacterium]